MLREVLDRQFDRLTATGRANDQPLAIVEHLRTTLNVPDSRHTHWHLDSAAASNTVAQYRWLPDPVSRWLSRLRHWSQLSIPSAIVLLAVLAALYAIWNRAGAAGIVVALAAAAVIMRLIRRWLVRP